METTLDTQREELNAAIEEKGKFEKLYNDLLAKYTELKTSKSEN